MSNELKLKRFIVDDWGISPAVNEAALYLAQRGCLYGISVIPYSRFSDYKMNEILATGVQVGCHINLTFNTEPTGADTASSWFLVGAKICASVLSAFVPFLRKKLFSQVMSQAKWVQGHFGRLDYLDGHHHIHLYPGILGATQKISGQLHIPFRVILDKSFKSNFLLGLWAKINSNNKDYFECLYLSMSDLEDMQTLERKVRNSLGLPVAIHPATKNDFIENKVDDHFIEGRVYQFQRLKDVLKI